MGASRTVVRRLAVVGTLLACALSACGDDSASEGQPLTGTSAVSGEESLIQLPHGQVVFEVAEPATVDESTVEDAEELDADALYVGVSWTFVPGAGVPSLTSGYAIADAVPATVSAVVDGEEFDLGPAYSVAGGDAASPSAYLPVTADMDSAELDLEVEFDGVTQAVSADGETRDAGVAAPLYDMPETPAQTQCQAQLTPQAARGDASCTVATVQLPWMTDLGWAEEGSTWTVVATTAKVAGLSWRGDDVTVSGQQSHDRVEGLDPVAELEDASGPGGALETRTVYSTEPGAELQLEVDRRLDIGPVARGVRLRAEAVLALRE